MIKTFGMGRTPETSLTWDERYPSSYVYRPSKAIANLKRRSLERRTREAMISLFTDKVKSIQNDIE